MYRTNKVSKIPKKFDFKINFDHNVDFVHRKTAKNHKKFVN